VDEAAVGGIAVKAGEEEGEGILLYDLKAVT